MNFEEYQKKTTLTAIYPNVGENLYYPTLGLTGEAGEVANKVKKIMRDCGGKITDEHRLSIMKEIGDVLWYCSQVCNELGVSLDYAAEDNLVKLHQRMAEDKLKGSGDERDE